MRVLSGASLSAVAMLALGAVVVSGCAKVGELKAMKAFKSANQAYSAQDYKKAAELYEEAIQSAPDTQAAHQSYFFLGNSYDNLYKPSKKGEADNDALLTKAVDNYTKAAETLSASNDPTDKTLARRSLEFLVNT
jgi:tetratricopeptide (TPR) repeat protein